MEREDEFIKMNKKLFDYLLCPAVNWSKLNAVEGWLYWDKKMVIFGNGIFHCFTSLIKAKQSQQKNSHHNRALVWLKRKSSFLHLVFKVLFHSVSRSRLPFLWDSENRRSYHLMPSWPPRISSSALLLIWSFSLHSNFSFSFPWVGVGETFQ